MNEKTTIEKAIERLEDLIKEAESHMTGNKIDGEIPIDDKTALEMAIQALEKQVPKKVIWENEKNGKVYLFSWAYCPNCGSDMCDKHNEEFQFCPDCGQALDWSEEVEECIPGW